MDPKAPRPSAAPSPRAPDGGYFTFHGLWAPGIRLFRQLRFGSKALILSATVVQKARRPTKATKSSQRKRMDSKNLRGKTKALRGKVIDR